MAAGDAPLRWPPGYVEAIEPHASAIVSAGPNVVALVLCGGLHVVDLRTATKYLRERGLPESSVATLQRLAKVGTPIIVDNGRKVQMGAPMFEAVQVHTGTA